MKTMVNGLLAGLMLGACGGCATLFNWEDHGVIRLESSEPETLVSVYNRGVLTDRVKTPCDYPVKAASDGYFRRSSYEFVFEKEGFYSQSYQRVGQFCPEFWLNILIGGPLGMFVIDPLTDSEYRLDMKPIGAILKAKPNKEQQ